MACLGGIRKKKNVIKQTYGKHIIELKRNLKCGDNEKLVDLEDEQNSVHEALQEISEEEEFCSYSTR